jgi:hypothetical protein
VKDKKRREHSGRVENWKEKERQEITRKEQGRIRENRE